MKDKRVFVTGGAGVIGVELVPMLVARGAKVLVGDLKPRPASFAPNVSYRKGDLNSLTAAELAAFAPDCLIHLAATFERSVETAGFWEENFRHNVQLSHHLMSLARDSRSLERVVFASSYLIYDPSLYQFPEPRETPARLTETDAIRPRNLTGMAKLAHEMELQFLSGFDQYRFSTLCVRIFRGYGRNSRDVISRWVRALLAGQPITVYRPEGCFDYVYAADSAEGLVRLADCARAQGIVNLGTGRSRRVSDVLDVLRKIFPDAKVETSESDIPFEASEADVSCLRELVHWVPRYDIDAAIPEIVAHESRCLNATSAITENQARRNVLVSSVSRKAPLLRAMQEALGRIDGSARVVAGDLDPEAPARHIADEFWEMPPVTEDALPALLKGCEERGIAVVLPTRDGELSFWAERRARFRDAGIQVIVSDAAPVERCLDKLAFARFGREAGLPVIDTAETPDAVGDGPYVVKERYGAGAKGMGLDLSRDAAIRHAKTLVRPIFQPFVSGPEISIDAWLDHGGKVVGVVLRRRDRVILGESQITTTFRDETLEREAVRILEMLALRGPVVLQAIVVNGALKVIECNPRFGGASTTGVAVGLDSFFWSLSEAFGTGPTPSFNRSSGEVRQIRLPVDVLVNGPDF